MFDVLSSGANGLVWWAIAVCALAAAWKLPGVNRPARWLVRRNITEPLSKWFKEHTTPDPAVLSQAIDRRVMPLAVAAGRMQRDLTRVVYELSNNGGHSFRDGIEGHVAEVNRFMRESTEDRAQLHENQTVLMELINIRRHEGRASDAATFDTGTPGVEYEPPASVFNRRRWQYPPHLEDGTL